VTVGTLAKCPRSFSIGSVLSRSRTAHRGRFPLSFHRPQCAGAGHNGTFRDICPGLSCRAIPSRSCPTTRLQWAAKKEPAIRCVGRPGSSRRRQLMRRLCGSRLRCGRGYCRRQAAKGRLHCVLHGGAAGSGHHLTEDRSHSRTLGKSAGGHPKAPRRGQAAECGDRHPGPEWPVRSETESGGPA
jgi:hypothetical protein